MQEYLDIYIQFSRSTWAGVDIQNPDYLILTRLLTMRATTEKLKSGSAQFFSIVTKSLWIFQACNFQCIDKVY